MYSDINTQFQRNRIWSDDAQYYLGETMSRCKACIASKKAPLSKKVALNSLNRQVDDEVMIDHSYLDQIRLFSTEGTEFMASHLCI